LTAPNISAASANAYQFAVTFSDNECIGGYDLYQAQAAFTVNGPNGFSQECKFVTAVDGEGGMSATGTYSIAPPNGNWNYLANGQYTISLKENSVADFSGNFAAGGVLGTFKVAAPVPDLGGTGLSDAGYVGIMSSGYNQTITDY